MEYKIALAGNPNCGKTTMFNDLTGSSQYVGNWPGVTVEKKEGKLKANKQAIIQDLPGIYSLSPYTLEEVVARNYLVGERPDAILNIVDATNIERNLYLSMQLIELGIPMVIALNMMDEVRASGNSIHIKKLSEQLGIPVIFIEADLPHMAAAFRTLGSILEGKAERGEELAAFVEQTVSMAEENAAKIQDSERLSVLYTSGSSGLNTDAKGSTQAQVLDLMGLENAAVVEDVSNKGGGNPINLEQLYRFDPDVILFAAGSIYAAAADDAAWQPLRAIEEGDFYEIPSMPYNWLSNPPSLNMLLGIWWLGNLLYPQYYDYDMVEKTQEIFKLFWDYDLSGEEARQMLANSTLKDTP